MLHTVCFANHHIEPCTKLRTYVDVPHTLNIIPVTFINGKYDGPTVLVTAGVHGSEYPGIAASMELGKELAPEDIHGCLIIMHPVNVSAFWARMAEICPEDGLNLNHVFPGNASLSRTYKLADFLLREFILKADYYLDLHSGDLQEDLHPYVYFPGNASEEVNNKSRELASQLNVEYMVRSTATTGAYNCAALHGVPSILVERGGTGFCCREDIDEYKDDVMHVLQHVGMTPDYDHGHFHTFVPQELTKIEYLEATQPACWYHAKHGGEMVEEGELLGYTTDFFGEKQDEFHAKFSGVMLYMTPALSITQGRTLCAYAELPEGYVPQAPHTHVHTHALPEKVSKEETVEKTKTAKKK